uniref:Major sperm protein n=1 Tax=Setaria digitata TaxID=48799 RepID=A0A915PVF7_9BILA
MKSLVTENQIACQQQARIMKSRPNAVKVFGPVSLEKNPIKSSALLAKTKNTPVKVFQSVSESRTAFIRKPQPGSSKAIFVAESLQEHEIILLKGPASLAVRKHQSDPEILTSSVNKAEHTLLENQELIAMKTFGPNEKVEGRLDEKHQAVQSAETQIIPPKESYAETEMNRTEQTNNISGKEVLSIPSTGTDTKKSHEQLEISQDTPKEELNKLITWVATGKTIVTTQYLQAKKKHMTSRGLRFLRRKTGLDEFNLAIFIGGVTSLYLMAGQDAQIVANAILTVTPILLTYVFPAEKPPTPQLLIYWSAFGLLTLLDPNFEPRSGYYFIKVVLLALLFLHPFDGADRILWHIRLIHSDIFKDESAVIPFTKEELTTMKEKVENKWTLQPEASQESKNPMLLNSQFRIEDQEFTSPGGLSTNYSPHDLQFEPTKYLVFNGPYDFENITYFIRIRNTSTKHIAYVIKSNAIPRVFATPPCGILPPKQKCDIAVTVKKMEKFVEQLVEKDRLAFDYVFCSPETKEFKFKLLQVYNSSVPQFP